MVIKKKPRVNLVIDLSSGCVRLSPDSPGRGTGNTLHRDGRRPKSRMVDEGFTEAEVVAVLYLLREPLFTGKLADVVGCHCKGDYECYVCQLDRMRLQYGGKMNGCSVLRLLKRSKREGQSKRQTRLARVLQEMSSSREGRG